MEKYREMKKINKILDFLEIEFVKSSPYLTEATIETILDFLELKTKKNYKYYPWFKKIMEKKIELFGIF